MHETKFLLITCCLVVLAGVPSVYSIARDPNPPDAELQGTPAESRGRGPASIKLNARSVVLDYTCDENKSFEVSENLVRLRGSACLGENLRDVSITNISNGFTGSMIFLKNKSFTTDFMEIQEGENKFHIQAVNEKGQTVKQTFTVHRRMPASAPSQK
jgi:hypothetical protein